MAATYEETLTAYWTWKDATGEHLRQMLAAMDREPTNWGRVNADIRRLVVLRENWMIKSKPFVRFLP